MTRVVEYRCDECGCTMAAFSSGGGITTPGGGVYVGWTVGNGDDKQHLCFVCLRKALRLLLEKHT